MQESTHVVGRKPVLEQLASDAARVEMVYIQKGLRDKGLGAVFEACSKYRVRYKLLPKSGLDKIFPGNHQGVAAQVAAAAYAPVRELLEQAVDAPLPLILALDHVQDPGNVGAMARTLWAMGGAGLITTRHESAPMGAGAMKASAGAIAKLPCSRVANLSQALDAALDMGLGVYCAAKTENSESLFTAELYTPAVVVLGNEEAGIRKMVAKRCAKTLHIPFARDFDSLNVAQAAAMVVAEFARRAK